MTDKIAILPLGAYEQHGPHLPLETDSLIASGFMEALKARLPEDLAIKFLPCETIGYSPEHSFVPETRSLDYAEAIGRWIEKGRECHDEGIDKIIFFNAHGGNSALLSVVVTELRIKYDIMAVATSWGRFLDNFSEVSATERALDIHAGLLETSLLLAMSPDLVDLSKARFFSNQQQKMLNDFHYLRAYGRHFFGWSMADLNHAGACGNAASASALLGEKVIDHVLTEFIKLLYDVKQFDRATYFYNFRSELP